MDENNLPNREAPEEELPVESSRCSKINVKLLPYKSFYFFFFSAVGSLFPYLAIFYKQLWLSARQTGVLIGIRPLLQLVSSSSWGIIADISNKSRYIFLISLVGWLFTNFSLSLVKHETHIGPCRDNGSLTVFDKAIGIMATGPFLRNETFQTADAEKALRTLHWKRLKRRNGKMSYSKESNRTWNEQISRIESTFKKGITERKIDEQSSTGHSPWSLHALLNLKVSTDTKISQTNNGVFTILLIITIVGTLVAAPAIPFADTATLHVLGNHVKIHNYLYFVITYKQIARLNSYSEI